MTMNKIPDWFGPALATAQHQDNLNNAYWWQRLLHRLFISWRCPCCQRWEEMNHPHKKGTKLQSTNIQKNTNFLLPKYADEKDDPIAFNEAHSFHDDCGDR